MNTRAPSLSLAIFVGFARKPVSRFPLAPHYFPSLFYDYHAITALQSIQDALRVRACTFTRDVLDDIRASSAPSG